MCSLASLGRLHYLGAREGEMGGRGVQVALCDCGAQGRSLGAVLRGCAAKVASVAPITLRQS